MRGRFPADTRRNLVNVRKKGRELLRPANIQRHNIHTSTIQLLALHLKHRGVQRLTEGLIITDVILGFKANRHVYRKETNS